MDTILGRQLKKQEEHNPHKRMHKVIFIVVVACLTAQVLEGSFIIPYILIHFGFPTLSMKEVCDEMYIIAYKNEDRECNFPYPLFAGPEPWLYKDMSHVIGSPAPPRPYYEGFGFRETIERREERMIRKAGEAAALKGLEPADAESGTLDESLGMQIEDSSNKRRRGYEGVGFREVIQRREERLARQAAEAAALESIEPGKEHDEGLQDPLAMRLNGPYAQGITGYDPELNIITSAAYLGN